jgi:hypothetical protein
MNKRELICYLGGMMTGAVLALIATLNLIGRM